VRLVLLFCALAGCDELFGLDEITHYDAAFDAFDPNATCPAQYDLAFVAGSKHRVVSTLAERGCRTTSVARIFPARRTSS